MKKFLSLFLAAVMLIGMSACSSAVSFEPLPEDEQIDGMLSNNSSVIYGDDEDSLVTKPGGGIIGGIIGGGNLDEDSSITNVVIQGNTTTQADQTTRPSSSTNNGTTTTKGNTSFADPATCSHSFRVISLEDSTCLKTGKKVSYCGKCDTTRTESIAKKTSHTGGKATCKARAVCTVCKQPYGQLADHHSADNNNDDCTRAVTCDTCGKTLVAAKSAHSWVISCMFGFCENCDTYTEERADHEYKNGKCINCYEADPNYDPSSGGSSGGNSGNSGGSTSSAKIDWVYNIFPVNIHYGTITSATAEISGSTLILRLNMQRESFGGTKSMRGYYRISNSSFDTVTTGSFSSDMLSSGATTTVTVSIPGVITSSGKYYVYLSKYDPSY